MAYDVINFKGLRAFTETRKPEIITG